MSFPELQGLCSRILRGFLPINKPIGISTEKLRLCLNNDLRYMTEKHGLKLGYLEFNYTRSLYPYASGLITFILGADNILKRNFSFSQYVDRATCELGVRRENAAITGEILDRSSIDHVDIDLIKRTLNQFENCELEFARTASNLEKMNMGNLNLNKHQFTIANMYNTMTDGFWEKPERPVQKYPFIRPPRSYKCTKVELIDYHKPFLTFDIHTIGCHQTFEFMYTLGEKLGTHCSLNKLTRLVEGPLHVDDLRVIQIHEATLDCYLDRMSSLVPFYRRYLKQFDDKFEKPVQIRP